MAEKRRIRKDELIELLKSGEWELGWSNGWRDSGHYWIQRGGLCKGGESMKVHANSVESLIKSGVVERAPRQENQQYWLTRYRLKG